LDGRRDDVYEPRIRPEAMKGRKLPIRPVTHDRELDEFSLAMIPEYFSFPR
jgi:hypothetical protein